MNWSWIQCTVSDRWWSTDGEREREAGSKVMGDGGRVTHTDTQDRVVMVNMVVGGREAERKK